MGDGSIFRQGVVSAVRCGVRGVVGFLVCEASRGYVAMVIYT